MEKVTNKLTTRTLDKLSRELPEGDEVWDTDVSGYHVRAGKRGLSLRFSYYNALGKRRVLTIGRYGHLTAAQGRSDATDAAAVVSQGGDPRADLEEAKADAERQEQQTLRVYLEGPYTAYQKRKKDGKATLQRIRRAFTDWLDKPMGGFTRVDVDRWQADQEAVKKPKDKGKPPPKPLAFSTLKRNYGALYTLLEHAAERNVIPENPLKGVRLQKPALSEEELAENGTERRYLEPEEVEALFVGLESYQEKRRQERRNSRAHGKPGLPDLDHVTYVDHVVPWLLMMYYTGLRPGDLFGLRWEHVTLSSPAKIRKTIEKTAHKRPEPQTFPLSTSAKDVLKTWHKQQGEPKTGLVFPSSAPNVAGKRLNKDAMQNPWEKVREMAGLNDNLALYTLRHNFASQLVMAGTDLLTVSKLMAHSDIQTTIKHYADLAEDHKLDAVEAFAKLVSGISATDDSAKNARIEYRISEEAGRRFAIVSLEQFTELVDRAGVADTLIQASDRQQSIDQRGTSSSAI